MGLGIALRWVTETGHFIGTEHCQHCASRSHLKNAVVIRKIIQNNLWEIGTHGRFFADVSYQWRQLICLPDCISIHLAPLKNRVTYIFTEWPPLQVYIFPIKASGDMTHHLSLFLLTGSTRACSPQLHPQNVTGRLPYRQWFLYSCCCALLPWSIGLSVVHL